MTAIDRDIVKAMDCELKSCGKQIGMDDFVVCQDGINNRQAVFHKKCFEAAKASDVQRHIGIHLNPGHLGLVPRDLG